MSRTSVLRVSRLDAFVLLFVLLGSVVVPLLSYLIFAENNLLKVVGEALSEPGLTYESFIHRIEEGPESLKWQLVLLVLFNPITSFWIPLLILERHFYRGWRLGVLWLVTIIFPPMYLLQIGLRIAYFSADEQEVPIRWAVCAIPLLLMVWALGSAMSGGWMNILWATILSMIAIFIGGVLHARGNLGAFISLGARKPVLSLSLLAALWGAVYGLHSGFEPGLVVLLLPLAFYSLGRLFIAGWGALAGDGDTSSGAVDPLRRAIFLGGVDRLARGDSGPVEAKDMDPYL